MFVGAKIVRVCGGFTHFLSHRVKFFSAGSWDGGAKMRSTGPIWYWLFCSSDCRTSSTPVSWWCLSPRLGFASWRSLNYFAVARHLYSSSGGVLHSTEQDESFRFDYFSHLSGGLRLRLRPPATYRLTFQVFIFRSRYDVFSGALFTECIFLRVFFRAQLACGSLYRGYP